LHDLRDHLRTATLLSGKVDLQEIAELYRCKAKRVRQVRFVPFSENFSRGGYHETLSHLGQPAIALEIFCEHKATVQGNATA
jgi:hypothetical protein